MSLSRLNDLGKSLQRSGLEALALNPGPSLVYLTGLHFHLMERPVVVFFTPDRPPVLVLPELDMLNLEGLDYEVKAFPYGEDPAGWPGVFEAAAKWLGLACKRLGVEPRAMRLLEYGYVRQAAGEVELEDASEAVSALRVRKDAGEVAAMRRAVRVAQEGLEAALPAVRIGMTEEEIAAELVVQLLRHGCQPDLPFAPIVSSGPNGANPHAVPSKRKLQSGDLLVVDWGAAVDGYISDLTRTFAVGKAAPEFEKIHRVVQEANAAGRAAAAPGAPCAAVDRAARAVIEWAGYGEYFTHRTGHGIGLEGHEEPYMRGDNQTPLEPGMAFTGEPGIYLPGRNGVRIEDNLVITENGADCLSDMPRELRTIG